MTNEEAIWAMQFYKEKLYNGIFNQYIKAFDIAIAALQGRQTTMEWISVDERLPEKAGFCLVAMQNGVVSMVCFETQGGHPYFWYSDSLHELKGEYAVTHWMPLPEPPKEGTT